MMTRRKTYLPLVLLSLALSACSAGSTSRAAGGPPATATVATAPSATPSPAGPPGTISGQLMYPADPPMPSLAIYAISVANSRVHFHVTTVQGQFDYTIKNTAPGIYNVVAYLALGHTTGNDKALSGGYTKFVPCSATGAAVDCTDHTLIPVTVHPSEQVKDIGPNDYYGGTMPPQPQ
jgi:hypothetical protein